MFGMHRDRMRRSFQRGVQLLSAALLNGYAVGFQKGRIFTGGSKAVCVPVLNCYSCPGALGACPMGALQTALGGSKGHFPFYVLGTLMLFGIVLGRAVCGLLCPFGLVQDLLAGLPLPKRRIPKRIDRPARLLKYVVLLGMVIALPALAVAESGIVTPYFCKYLCPAGTLGGGIPHLLANPVLRQAAGALWRWKLLVLLLLLAASAVVHRPFCKYLCPLGAFYALFHRFSFYQLRLDRERCTGCGVCARACPMQVALPGQPDSPECIRCGKCGAVCPTQAIRMGFAAAHGQTCRSAGPGAEDAPPVPPCPPEQ